MQSELRFYEGLQGSGVVASITYGQSRVIFDFGAPFSPMTQPFDGQAEPRVQARVRDAIRLGQIPAIAGVFSAEVLGPGSPLQPYEQSNLTTGIIISHLHLDHMSGIGLVHPAIPVYLHRDAWKLQGLLDAVGESVGDRAYSPVDLYVPFAIGEIQVTAYFSDHPCAGAVGYLIEPPDGKFYYSGDVRLHGNRLPQALADLEKLARANVDVLILETTTFSDGLPDSGADLAPSLALPAGMQTEQQLMDQLRAEVQGSDQLAIFNLYHRDMELLRGLFEIAAQTGRELVFEPQTAYVVRHMLSLNPRIYLPDNRAYADRQQPYFQDVLQHTPGIVDQAAIRAAPGRYLLQNSYVNILELFDLPMRGAKYFHLYGIPLVEGAKDYANMLRVLRMVGAEHLAFANLYCFNHAYPANLLYMADMIRAKTLIGVHSAAPELLISKHSQQFLPVVGETYRLESGGLLAKV